MFNFDDEQQDYNNKYILDQMEDLGYDSHNAIIILGTMGVILFQWILRAFIYMIMRLVYRFRQSEKLRKALKKVKRGLFFNDISIISIEGYLTFLIAGYLNMNKPLFTESGEKIANLVTVIIILISLVLLPAAFIWFLC
jgi:hypothetical protein